MHALTLAAGLRSSDLRERIDRIDLGDFFAGEDPARALWLDRLYRNFLFLCALHPNDRLAPPAPVEAVWRAHASEPERYRGDCLRALGRVPPLTASPEARGRFHHRHREELGVDPLLPDGRRELIDSDELAALGALTRRPARGVELPWDASRQRMGVAGDVAHWSGDLQARIRREGVAVIEWDGQAPSPHTVIEQLSWTFGRPGPAELGPPLVIALIADAAVGDVVLIRATGVWRFLRHRFPADLLEAAAAPDALIVELDGRHVACPLLPRLSRSRRGLAFSTAATRVFAAPGIAAVYRAVGEVLADPDLQLRLRLAPGRVLVLDHLSWRIGRSTPGLHRVEFASPSLVGLGLGFKVG